MAKSQTLKTKIYLIPCYMKFLFSKFDTSPFNSIWLEISMNWHTESQRPMKKCSHFTKGRIHSCLAHTACNKGSFTSKIVFCSILIFPNCMCLPLHKYKLSFSLVHPVYIKETNLRILYELRYVHLYSSIVKTVFWKILSFF